jgi:hypothetical protein
MNKEDRNNMPYTEHVKELSIAINNSLFVLSECLNKSNYFVTMLFENQKLEKSKNWINMNRMIRYRAKQDMGKFEWSDLIDYKALVN